MEKIEYRSGAVNAGECVSKGWSAAGQNYGLFFGVAFVVILIIIVISLIPFANIILDPIIGGPLSVGLYYVYLRKIDGESADFGMAFSGFSHFVPAIVVSFVLSAPFIILDVIQLSIDFTAFPQVAEIGNPQMFQAFTAVQIAIGVFTFLIFLMIQILLYFSYMLIAEYKLGAIDAMKLSVEAASANLSGLILLIILEILLGFAGALACLIGILFIMPVIYAADVCAYRQVFPKINLTLQNEPPPPNVYDSNFGIGQ